MGKTGSLVRPALADLLRAQPVRVYCVQVPSPPDAFQVRAPGLPDGGTCGGNDLRALLLQAGYRFEATDYRDQACCLVFRRRR